MRELAAWMRQALQPNPTLYARVLGSLAVVLALWLIRLLAMYLVRRQSDDAQVHYRWRKISAYLAGTLGLCVVVVDVRMFQFTLLEIGNWVAADQSTGRVAHIPNRRMFNDVLINYGKGFEYIWNEVPVRITFESDWRKGKALLQEIADRHAAHLSEEARDRVQRAARRYLIVYSALTPTMYTRLDVYGVLLTIRYLCEPRRRRSSETAIWEDILQAFSEHADVEFAYPTQRFYDRRTEG